MTNLNVLDFANRRIYVSPDPQGHRFTWIWFAYARDAIYVSAHGVDSTWFQAAKTSGHGQVRFDDELFEAAFTPIDLTDTALIDEIWVSYKKRYPGADSVYSPQQIIDSTPTLTKITVLQKIN